MSQRFESTFRLKLWMKFSVLLLQENLNSAMQYFGSYNRLPVGGAHFEVLCRVAELPRTIRMQKSFQLIPLISPLFTYPF